MLDQIQTSTRKSNRPRRPYRRRGRHFRGRERAAPKRAFTAARLYLDREVPTLAAAATSCGSCPGYVRAAAVLIEAENQRAIAQVLRGDVPLLKAAAGAKHLAGLVKAYRAAPAADHVAFAKVIGAAALFDAAVAPAI